ncbi:MAG TPA: 3-dehydroquinate synthase [Arenimonas sp.]|nr:3-dehydroquinate synthase [Arenimonas sp.]
MHQLTVSLADRSYPIRIESGLLNQSVTHFDLRSRKILIVSDTNVAPLYSNNLKAVIQSSDCPVWTMPAGEQEKNLARFTELIHFFAENKLTRDSCIVALGGGVIGDLAGFAAACYMRGIDFIQVPTTLLAMVDSSVGGKTAVDLPSGKNLVGAFYQPKAVWIDPNVLITLPDREYKAGLAEVVKYGAILDTEFFAWLENNAQALLNKQADVLENAIAKSCQYKADIVARDEHEQGDRALLNFGHTFGHALEVLLDYSDLVHGEAVAIGMVLAAKFSAEHGYSSNADSDRLEKLLSSFGLPTQMPTGLNAEHIIDKMRIDKKAVAGEIRLILWNGIGEAFVEKKVSSDALLHFLQAM